MNPAEKETELPPEPSRRQGGCWTHLILWLFVLTAVGFISVSVPRRGHGPSPRTMCAANLGGIARGCLMYAESNRGRLPVSLDVLTRGGKSAYLHPKQLVCPASGRPYVYRPNMKYTDDPRNVLAYEPLENHGNKGANVAFLDGHVRWQPRDLFQELLLAAQTQPACVD